MPRIKRWFPVSHDINGDPEFCLLCEVFGAPGIRVWLELLSIADRNDGEVPGDYQSNASPLAGRCHSTVSQVTHVLHWLADHLWIESQSPIRIRNYAKYHVTRDVKQIPPGISSPSPPSYPSYPSLPNLPKEKEVEEKESAAHPNGSRAPADPSAAWPPEDVWLLTFLQTQTVLPQLPASESHLFDYGWWEQVSYACNGLTLDFITREFAKMGAFVSEKPRKKPTPRGWKPFIRQWLTRATDYERRFTHEPVPPRR